MEQAKAEKHQLSKEQRQESRRQAEQADADKQRSAEEKRQEARRQAEERRQQAEEARQQKERMEKMKRTKQERKDVQVRKLLQRGNKLAQLVAEVIRRQGPASSTVLGNPVLLERRLSLLRELWMRTRLGSTR